MKFVGKADEYLELVKIETPNCTVFREPDAESLTVMWFQSDNNELLIDKKRYLFKKNEAVFLTEFHEVKVIKKGKTKLIRFNRPFYCIIDNDVEVSCRGLLFFGATQLPIINIEAEHEEHFQIIWRMFEKEMEFVDNMQYSMLQMMLKRFLILCARLYKEQHQEGIEDKESNIIREFNFLVEQNFRTHHTVADYADMLNKSPKTLSNVFAKLGNKPPLQYINDRRLIEAKRLLHYTNKQIGEIADEIGFSDIQTFSRFFKKHQGVTPSMFKENK